MKFSFHLLLAPVFVLLFCFPAARAQTSEINIPAVLAEAKAKSAENWRRMFLNYPNYTFKFRKIWREADKNNRTREKSELYEIFPPPKCSHKKCRNVTILLAKDGVPNAPEKIERERRKAGEKLEQLENDKKAREFQSKRQNDWLRFIFWHPDPMNRLRTLTLKIDGQELLEKCEFFSAETETINGREAISLRFRARADAVFTPETSYAASVEGKIWIDAADKVFIRLAMWQKDGAGAAAAKFESQKSDELLANAAAVFDLTRTKEGIWFFRLGQFRGIKNPALFTKMASDFSIENFEHRFFATEIKTVEIND
ncbi:MAG: hypothetical protein M3384_16820 [Acidobacteriota bacterium]|nr:hypothetical protein [Acidobacteriota bacterium]